MRDRESLIKLRVGIFVLFLLFLFGAFVLTIGTQTRLFEERYTLRAAFQDIQGLAMGGPVRLAGFAAGTVQKISFSRDPADPRIHVEVNIDRRFQSRIREDSVATIATVGVVGDKVFEITVGSDGARILQPNEILRSAEPVDFGRLVAKGGEVLDGLADASQALKTILANVAGGRGLLPFLISEEAGGELIRDLAGVAKNLRRLSDQAEKGEGLLGALMAKDDVPLLESLNHSAASLEKTLKRIEKGEGLLHTLIFDEEGKDVVREIRATAAGLHEIVGRLQAGEGLIGALLTDPDGAQVLHDLRAAVADLRRTTHALAEGEGTLGALLQDPTVYEDISSLLRGTERSWILRGLIRSSIRDGRNADQQGKE
ncbi:MAG: MlaD family protein [Candidatus Methylomirabilales bacterium]